MDEKTEKSFARLKSFVLSNAHEEAAGLTDNKEKEIAARLDAKREELEKKFALLYKAKTEEDTSGCKAEILAYEFNAKKELIAFRQEIVDSVFKEVVNRVNTFKNTPNYKEWLIKKTNQALSECGKNSTVFVSGEDMPLLLDIDAKKCGRDMIGGVIAENDESGVVADYSIDEIISGLRSEFLSISGMTIEI